MDLVLEGFDTYLFDPVYASLYPVIPSQNIDNAIKGNASAVGVILGEKIAPLLNNWEYIPASQYLSFTPLKWAYESSWQRDDPWRQFISLFVITWYALRHVQVGRLFSNNNIAGFLERSFTSPSLASRIISYSIRRLLNIPSTSRIRFAWRYRKP